MSLSGKVAIVTGASSGIGKVVAQDLAAEGCKVGIIARRQDRIDALAAELNEQGHTVRSYAADVTRQGDLEAAFAFFAKELGPIDILVNNAGFGLHKSFNDLSMEDLRSMMETNYFGAASCIKLVLPGMQERDSGHIVNVASIAGEVFRPMFSGYSATKAAVVGLTECIANELAGTGVRISMVNPGPVTTEFFDDPSWENSVLGPQIMVSTPESVSRAVVRTLKSGRFATYVPGWIGTGPAVRAMTGSLGRTIIRLMYRQKG